MIRYLAPTDEPPVYHASVGGAEAELLMDGQFEDHVVAIENGRAGSSDFSLDHAGFVLRPHETAVTDFYDPDQVRDIYEKEAAALIGDVTGAGRVVIFDHTLRAGDQATRSQRQVREPSSVVHNDYTERSARQRVRDLLPAAEVEELLDHRFAIVNVWRPIRIAVENWSLTVCDARSVAAADLVTTERRAKDRIGELLLATYNLNHRWIYFPHMQPNEALLIKTFDSEADGRAVSCIHTAFEDPTSPPGAPPRESMETRAFVFFA
jgi:hypothetical protein